MKAEDFGIRTEFICSVAKNLADIRTGTWRMFPPVIDQGKCVACGICALYCPVKAIVEEQGKIVITYDYCKGCGVCIHECPRQVISFDTGGAQ